MRGVIEAAVKRGRTSISVLLLILVAGAVAYQGIPKEANPDVNIPNVYISLHHDGISPEDSEKMLVRPIEDAVRAIDGVKEISSNAFQGGGFVLLEFTAGFDIDQALDDVREEVDRAKKDLPEDSDEPTVSEVNLSLMPVLVVTVAGDVGERELLRYARRLRDEIQAIAGVLEANLTGGRDELLEVIADPVALGSYGLDAVEVLQIFNRSNRLVAAGKLDSGTGSFPIKVPGLFKSAADILNQPVKVNGDAVVRMGDLAMVRRVLKDRTRVARLNGKPALAIEVSKRIGENIIETNEKVRAVVAAETADWPEGVTVSFSNDESRRIRTMLSDLQNNVTSAILLVMVIIIAALGLRSAGLVGIAIPGSFLLGILALSNLGLTMNIVVLFSLILAVGMLVDGAIVVTELADRNMANGMDRRRAYIEAAHRMSWPIIASTATTLAAFMPLVFWPGIVGEFMKFLPITLIATLSASLLMALIFIPSLGGVIGKTVSRRAPDPTENAIASGRVSGAYVTVMSRLLRHPLKILLVAAGTLVGVQTYYATHGNGVSFFPDVEPETATVMVHARGNYSVDEQLKLVMGMEREILDVGGFQSVFLVVGRQSGAGRAIAADVVGQFTLEFKPWDARDASANDILAEIRQRSRKFPGVKVETSFPQAGPPTGKPVQILFKSRNPNILPQVVAAARAKFESTPGLLNIEDERDVPGIEWRVVVDRAKAAQFGVDVALVGQYVKLITNGMRVSSYRPDDSREEIDIVARFPEAYRNLAQLDQFRIQSARGLVPASNFTRLEPHPKVGVIKRVDAVRAIKVMADVEDGFLPADKVTELRQWLETTALPPGVSYEFKGEDEEQAKAQAFLVKAFSIALFIMAIILVTQFNSFYSVFLILSAVIMSTIGVMIGLLVTGEPFDIVLTGIGVIALAGIVVNNNIVLIDTFDYIKRRRLASLDRPWTREDGMEAILRTGAQRMRPVLLTTVTTILGLIPMVLQTNIDFITREVSIGAPSTQWWTSLSSAIVFGLAFATLLTLVVTPAALMVRENVQTRRQRRRRALNPAASTT